MKTSRAGHTRDGARRRIGAVAAALTLTAGLVSAVSVTSAGAARGSGPTLDDVGTRLTAPSAVAVRPPSSARAGEVGPGLLTGAEVGRLPSSSTALATGARPASREPALLRREATLWMSGWNDGPPSDAQEVADLEVVQDVPAQKVTVTARYYDAPSAAANSALFLWFGSWDEEENCVASVQLAAVAGSTSSADAAAVSMDESSAGTATRGLAGDTMTVTWSGGRAGEKDFSCVYASSFLVDGAGLGAEIERGYAEEFEPTYEEAPVFDFYAGDLNAAYPGKWNPVYVSVRNEGDATASRVTLSAKGAKIKLRRKTVSLGSIAPGKSRSINLKVKLKGRKIRTLNLTAKASGGWSATSRTKVGFRPLPTRLKSLVGRSFWASPKEPLTGWNIQQYTFVNKKWVHVGVTKNGYPTKCSAKVKECRRYTYKPKKKLVRIGKVRAKVDSEGLRTLGKEKVLHTPLVKPKANLRAGVHLSYYDYSGCEGSFQCSTWWRHLTLKKDGSFTWTYEAIHSSGMPPNQTFVSVSGPDKVGTYKILSKGRMRITFVDEETGAQKTETWAIGIDQDVLGRHGPDKGLLIAAMPHLP
ncbi:hypothetical protein IEQ44_04715 [Nocardioides sp. Y6]|uniref:CARDB domain-containing protein n=1 Tax=Nocardioides malaquae TaxID=2773426 RepID=A0ABR9RQW2_9ACTN|nr:hypothetical protein [Nocardioides malaquae]MBE7323951.1 hypothetical protein [Nocardioides malaquae]